MLDPKVFSARMIFLLNHYDQFKEGNDAYNQMLPQMWHSALKDRLTTEEFNQACDLVFQRCTFFPNPGEFIALVKGDAQALAREQWALILKSAAQMRFIDGVDAIAQYVVNTQMGGLSALGAMNVDALPYRAKDFSRGYAAAKQGSEAGTVNLAHLLPAVPLENRVIGDRPPYGFEQYQQQMERLKTTGDRTLSGGLLEDVGEVAILAQLAKDHTKPTNEAIGA